jgi:threonyl-tRNA synthetase
MVEYSNTTGTQPAEARLRRAQEAAGGGLVFWQPKGAAVRNVIETFWKDIHMKRGYSLLYTPHIAKVDLWKTSGHFEHYGENMFDQMQVRSPGLHISGYQSAGCWPSPEQTALTNQ